MSFGRHEWMATTAQDRFYRGFVNGVWIYGVMEGASLLELSGLHEVVDKVFSHT